MALDFPNAPVTNQVFQNWQWDGAKWIPYPGLGVPILNQQIFTSSGTYVPTAGMQTCIIEAVGGGGGGAGCNGGGSLSMSGGGGGAGGYSRKLATAAQIGASQPVTIGAAGTSSSGTATAGNGGATSLGSLCVANGGAGATAAINGTGRGTGGLGGTPGVGDFTAAGAPGGNGSYGNNTYINANWGQPGGSSIFGGGGQPTAAVAGTSGAGQAATSYGAGGGPGWANGVASNISGGAGSAGVVIVTEYGLAPAPPQASGSPVLNTQIFTANGTYVPTVGMVACTVECVGGGAGGCGTNAAAASVSLANGGGGGGGYSRKFLTAAQVGTSQTVTVGVGGTAGAIGAAGGAGGNSSLGTLCLANGAAASAAGGGPGGSVAGAVGDVLVAGCAGLGNWNIPTTQVATGSLGGASVLGGGGRQTNSNSAGLAGGQFGGGGSGGYSYNGGAGQVGGAGAPGVVIVTEYASIQGPQGIQGIQGLAGPAVAANLALEVQLTANQTGNATGAWSINKYNNVVTDSQAAYNASTGVFTPKVAGLYLISATICTGVFASQNCGMAIIKNNSIAGAESQSQSRIAVATTGNAETFVMSALVYCNGTTDTVDIRGYVSSSANGIFYGPAGTQTGQPPTLTATLLQTGPAGPVGPAGPAVAANIALEVSLTANQTGLTALAWNTCKFNTKVTDVQNAYSTSTGLFTPTVAGLYAVSATVGCASGAGSRNGIAICKNGAVTSAESQSFLGIPNTGAINLPSSASALVFCNGTTDTISVQAFLPTGVTTILSSANLGAAVNMVATLLQTGPKGDTGPAGPAVAANIALEAQLTANQTGVTIDAWNTVKYNTVVTDTQSAYSASTGLFTPKQAGLYAISASVGVFLASQGWARIAIVKNGALTNAESQINGLSVGTNNTNSTISNSALIFCNGSTDTISVQCYHHDTTFYAGAAVGSIVNVVATLLQTGPAGPTGPQGPAGTSTYAMARYPGIQGADTVSSGTTTSASYTTPANSSISTIYKIRMCGAGGGGGGTGASNAMPASGGGGAEFKEFLLSGVPGGGTINMTVGNGGNYGTYNAVTPGIGGDTTLGIAATSTTIVCKGGTNGVNNISLNPCPGGGGGSGGATTAGSATVQMIMSVEGQDAPTLTQGAATSGGGASMLGLPGQGGPVAGMTQTYSSGYGTGGRGGYAASYPGWPGQPGVVIIERMAG